METTKLMLWIKLIITHRRFLSKQVVVKAFQTLRTTTTGIYCKCFTCKTLAGYRATRSPFKVQVCQIMQILFRRFEISQGLVSRLLVDGGEKDYWCLSWFNNITCWMEVSSNATTLQAFTSSNGCSYSSNVSWINKIIIPYICVSVSVSTAQILVSLVWKLWFN